MTGRAARQLGRCPDFVIRRQFLADFFLICRRLPIHTKNLIVRAEVLFRIAMTVHAPIHRQSPGLEYQRHLIDLAVASRTPHALINVNAVIEINEIGQAMDLYPLYRFICTVAFAYWLEVSRVVEKHRMTIHAGLGGRDACHRGGFHAGVTIAAIDTVIANMMLMAELNGLFTHYVLARVIRGTGCGEYANQGERNRKNSNQDTESSGGICAAMKNLGHVSVALVRRSAPEEGGCLIVHHALTGKCVPGSRV